jgi:hypothetical protein
MRRAPRHHVVVLPHHQHPRARARGLCGPVLPLAPPGGGPSSSGMSTTASRSLAVGASAGGADVAVLAAAVTTVVAAASCCGLVATAVPRGGSPIAGALPAARGALDECHLVGTDVSDLSALVGARAGTIGVTLQMRKYENEH